ncbi:MAG TPA: hypothetical protein GX517_12440 [Alicyclobacillus sp.]|nr:hypothetical protein [Alicyclobacillus sp.]
MEPKRIFSGVWAVLGLALAAVCVWAGVVGGFGAGPIIGILGGIAFAVWQGRVALGMQGHHKDEEGEDEWY